MKKTAVFSLRMFKLTQMDTSVANQKVEKNKIGQTIGAFFACDTSTHIRVRNFSTGYGPKFWPKKPTGYP